MHLLISPHSPGMPSGVRQKLMLNPENNEAKKAI